MRKLLAVITVLSMSFLAFFCTDSLIAQGANTLLISQVKVGGDTVGELPQEYVAIQNIVDHDVSLDDFYIEYYKTPSGQESDVDCAVHPWLGDSSSDHQILPLPDSSLQPQETLIIEIVMPDKRGGSLRIIEQKAEDNFIEHDLVGWDSDDSQAGCYESEAVRLNSLRVITRNLDYQGLLLDTDNNSQDFTVGPEPVIDVCSNITGLQAEVPPGYGQNPETGQCSEIEAANHCTEVVINEVLPNPLGPDKDHEFIELYNTSKTDVSLTGCGLKTSANNKEYLLDGETLKGGEYRAYYDKETGLTLPNAAGGTVWLISVTDDIDEVVYPSNMSDDVSYARFDNSWQKTYSATPGSKNVLTADLPCPAGQERNQETNRCRGVASADTLAACGPGRYRHPETNRCRNTATTTSSLVPCSAGQYRNPETNRCRKIAATTSSLKPCASDQYRNPATNRCKKVESGASLVPCKPGQERNPETNRCRKIPEVLAASAANPAQVSNAEDKPLGFDYRVWTMLGAATLGYGAWEYRPELRQWTRNLRSGKPKIKPPG